MISATCDSNCFFYIYPCSFLESETQCWLIHTTIVCLYPRWRPPPSWFSRRAVLDHGGTCIAHIYQHTKFSAYRSRISQDMPICVFPTWRPPPSWMSKKVLFWTPGDTCTAHIYQHAKFGACRIVGRELANICPFVHISRWPPPPSWIFKKCGVRLRGYCWKLHYPKRDPGILNFLLH